MKLIATQQFNYAGHDLKIDNTFESANDEDARMLKGFGKAKDAPVEAPKVEPKPAEPAPAPAAAPQPPADGLFETAAAKAEDAADNPHARGKYKRRDMRAQG